ncbi:hypothetical protein [Okeania sp. KiyG1]|nr:hypothetical protein [Okeania sp. KiyG1]
MVGFGSLAQRTGLFHLKCCIRKWGDGGWGDGGWGDGGWGDGGMG